jgi:hypothetical protein
MIGASDAKVAILPVVFLALLLYGAIIWLRDRRTSLPTWLAAGLALVVMGTLYLGQYRGHPSELGVHPFAVFGTMPAVVLLKSYVSGGLPAFSGKGLLLSASGVVFGLVGMLAPQLVGLVWALRRGWGRLAPRQIWLLAVLLAGLGLGLALNEPGTVNQLYFLFYGVAAGCVLSAEGLGLAWRSRPAGVAARRLVVFALGWLAVLAAVMEVPLRLTWFHGRQTEAQRYALWYAALFLSVALLYVIARRRLGPTRWPAASLACAAVLTVGFLDAPGDYLAPAVARKGDVVVDPLFKPLSVELYRSLAWVRDHTPSSAVLAVNNQWLGRARTAPYEFNYSAFSERRVFLEGWAYSQGVRDRGFLTASVNPFPERLRLNRAAFLGDRSALTVLKKKFGVRYLLVDPGGGDRVDTRSLMRATRIVHPARVPVFELP